MKSREKLSCWARLRIRVFAAVGIWALAIPCFAQTNCAPVPSGVLSWWRGQSNALDELGIAHGTLVGNTAFGPGRVGSGFVFGGLDDAVNVGIPAALQLQNFTIEGWVRRAHSSRSTQGSQTSASFFSGSPGGYGFGLLDDGRLFLTKIGVSAVFSTAARSCSTLTAWANRSVRMIRALRSRTDGHRRARWRLCGELLREH